MKPPPPPPPQPPPPPTPPSLSAALSNLTSHLQLSDNVLRSLPTATTTSTTSALLPCPFNPNHRLPPSSLFSHYLNCPFPRSLPHNFHYPLTLHSSTTTSASLPSLSADSSDVCISLEDYSGYNSPANIFFYQNCPGPVTPSIQPPPLLNLPRELYIECAGFNNNSITGKPMGFLVDFIRFLPSEIWAIQTEIEAWGGGFPAVYSSRILRAILRLRDCKLLHLNEWIISTSPRYGMIIDSAMRDHVILLVRLCLKVIVREAFEFLGARFSDGESNTEDNDVLSGLSNWSFECPVLVKVMMWLASQFCILFGEANGKFFAIDVLKECILDSAMGASLFPLEQENAEKVDAGNMKGETVANSSIFISQVAAGVAALHERSVIEGKIRVLRDSRPWSAYQRNMEHAYVSKIAEEERKKRMNYRPIIEHDGFLWQRSTNQDSNRVKTREELLAEERDYKRRRMSYRGKKLKRNTLEVMRDIIDECMEDIRQAGGIGGMSKDVTLGSENLNKNVSGSRRSFEIPEENSSRSHDYEKDLDSFGDDIQQPKRDSSLDHGRQYHDRNFKERIRYDDRGDYSGSQVNSHSREEVHGRDEHERSGRRRSESRERNYPKRNRDGHERSQKRRSESRERNYHKRNRDEHERSSLKRERYKDDWDDGHRRKSKRHGDSRQRDEDNSKMKANRNNRSHIELPEFEDRYDPEESRDIYEEEF